MLTTSLVNHFLQVSPKHFIGELYFESLVALAEVDVGWLVGRIAMTLGP